MRRYVTLEVVGLVVKNSQDVAAAAIYLMAKLSAWPKSPRSVITVFNLLQTTNRIWSADPSWQPQPDQSVDHVSEGIYQSRRNSIMQVEARLLRAVGFQTRVALPYTLCINMLQTLGATGHANAAQLSKRAFAHLNGALLSPQLLCLTHQPAALATAAIYLAARETDVRLPEEDWWEVFDLDREELGFLIVAYRSFEAYVEGERTRWREKKPILTADGLREELEA